MERPGSRWPAWLGRKPAGRGQAPGAAGGQHRRSRRLTWLGGAAAVAVAALLSWDALAPFDREAWDRGRGGADATRNPRRDLYVDAMDRLPAGTPRAAVHDLLGQPDSEWSNGDKYGDSYALGYLRFSIDAAWLIIEYDDDSLTTRWWIDQT